jgi:hypothetical protein
MRMGDLLNRENHYPRQTLLSSIFQPRDACSRQVSPGLGLNLTQVTWLKYLQQWTSDHL